MPQFRTMFSLLVISVRKLPGSKKSRPLQTRVATYPSEIQGIRAAMDRNERVHSELSAGFEAEENKANLDWRRALECLDRRRISNLAEHDRRHRELYRAIKKLEERVVQRLGGAGMLQICPRF